MRKIFPAYDLMRSLMKNKRYSDAKIMHSPAGYRRALGAQLSRQPLTDPIQNLVYHFSPPRAGLHSV
jgi:hypothetical protein